jgi:hypothetical protein
MDWRLADFQSLCPSTTASQNFYVIELVHQF